MLLGRLKLTKSESQNYQLKYQILINAFQHEGYIRTSACSTNLTERFKVKKGSKIGKFSQDFGKNAQKSW